MDGKRTRGAQAFERASIVFLAIAEARGAARPRALAESCGIPLSTTQRLISALARVGLVERTRGGAVVVSDGLRRAIH